MIKYGKLYPIKFFGTGLQGNRFKSVGLLFCPTDFFILMEIKGGLLYDYPHVQTNHSKLAMQVSRNTIIGNFVLTAFKLAAGILGHSSAMISDAIHSASDVFSTLIVMVGIRISGKKADGNHNYGHERLEAVAAILLAVVLAATGVFIGYSGVRIHPWPPTMAAYRYPARWHSSPPLCPLWSKRGCSGTPARLPIKSTPPPSWRTPGITIDALSSVGPGGYRWGTAGTAHFGSHRQLGHLPVHPEGFL